MLTLNDLMVFYLFYILQDSLYRINRFFNCYIMRSSYFLSSGSWRLSRHLSVFACVLAFLFSNSLFFFSQPLLANESKVVDPWRPLNISIFQINDFMDRAFLKPVAISYSDLLPNTVRRGVSNFFNNVDDFNVFTNNLFQLKLQSAASDSARIVLNSTVGVLGLFDVARTMGIRKNSEDFGQTLAYWGVDSGPYMMLPIFGASSVRDSFGFLIDTAMNPIRFIDGLTAKSSLFFLREIESRAFRLPLDDVVGGSPYLFVREAYFQRRDFLIRDGASVGGFSDF